MSRWMVHEHHRGNALLAVSARGGVHGCQRGHCLLCLLCWHVHGGGREPDVHKLSSGNVFVEFQGLGAEPVQRVSGREVLANARNDLGIRVPEVP